MTVLQPTISQTFASYTFANGCSVLCKKTQDGTFVYEVHASTGRIVKLTIGVDSVAIARIKTYANGCSLQLIGPRGVWAMRLIEAGRDALNVIEKSSLPLKHWAMQFDGDACYIQNQLGVIGLPCIEEHHADQLYQHDFVLGPFTQYGQLFNFKDWFLVRDGAYASGMMMISPQRWIPGDHVLCGNRNGSGAEIGPRADIPQHYSRRYILVRANADSALALKQEHIEYFEPPSGFAAWPAEHIARLGFARPERLASYDLTASNMIMPDHTEYAFGSADDLNEAIERCRIRPELAGGQSFWLGLYDQAKEETLAILNRFSDSLMTGGYLHPHGNPVACRQLTSAACAYHLLDVLGKWTDQERCAGACVIARLAELLFRRDFYDYGAAHDLRERSVYRGMLNQNFNTDRYVFVGLAGCVLPNHPHARRWRLHAIGQFEEQMRRFVYPNGAWEESHTYAQHVMMLLLMLAPALRRAPEHYDILAHRAFRDMCWFFPQILSPQDPLVESRRAIPAIGDHGYAQHSDFGYMYAWLCRLDPDYASQWAWVWCELGGKLTDPDSKQCSMFSPLLMPTESVEIRAPKLACIKKLDGFGAVIRRHFQKEQESLLVVRCGTSWAHYHPDQGSFWWWVNGRLICADSELGSGSLKHRHEGHNVMGYLKRTPMSYMDRVPYQVEECRQTDSCELIRCHIPVHSWQLQGTTDLPIEIQRRPVNNRSFCWSEDGRLVIHDDVIRAPDDRVIFHLHVVAHRACVIDERTIDFVQQDGVKIRLLSVCDAPISVELHQHGLTWHAALEHHAAHQAHEITVDLAG